MSEQEFEAALKRITNLEAARKELDDAAIVAARLMNRESQLSVIRPQRVVDLEQQRDFALERITRTETTLAEPGDKLNLLISFVMRKERLPEAGAQ